MRKAKRKNTNIVNFLPGLVILVVGMIALHSSVKISSEQATLQQYYDVISAQYTSLTGGQDHAQGRRVQILNERIRMREDWLYWSVIALSLAAFLLLILNAHKLRQLEAVNTEKQEGLKLLQQRLAAIEASFEGIAIVDSDGNLSYMNVALMKLHGISVQQQSEYIGQPWFELYRAEEQEKILQKILPEFEEKGFWHGKSEVLPQDDDKIQTKLSMRRLEDGGFIATTRDVTKEEKADSEKQEMQDQLFQAQKMEAIGRLAGGIAHDFNNILAAMNGNAEFLYEDLERGSQSQKFAFNILQAGRQARTLVDSILTFSRHQDGDLDYIDLCDPLQESLSMLRVTLPKTIDVETEIDVLKAPIHANATQISQMIMNLCVNACDAIEDDKGKVCISLSHSNVIQEVPLALLKNELPSPDRTPLIRMEDGEPGQTLLYLGSVARNQNYVKLMISDSGSGMSRSIMEKIFEPFFTTKDMHKGTGLGLASVHGTITAYRGALIINSIIGQGTCFSLFFPVSEAQEIQRERPEEVHYEEACGTVLLVEDQLEVQEMAATMLRRLGYSVETASTGLEALDMLRERPKKFDVVVTDQNMPKMTGLELVTQAHYDFEDLPFIVLSGYSEEKLQDLIKGHTAIKAVIRKPVSQRNLGKTISEVLTGQSDKKADEGQAVA